jgi:hypothetical protein
MTNTNFELEILQEPTAQFPSERYLNFRVLSGAGEKFLQHVELSWTYEPTSNGICAIVNCFVSKLFGIRFGFY